MFNTDGYLVLSRDRFDNYVVYIWETVDEIPQLKCVEDSCYQTVWLDYEERDSWASVIVGTGDS